MKNIIDCSLRDEIYLKKKKLARRPEYFNERNNLILEDIRSIGDVYSFWIENPELRKALLTENRNPKTIKKEAKKGIEQIHNGWYFLKGKERYGFFINLLSTGLLKHLNKIIYPNVYGGKFRNEVGEFGKSVTLGYRGYTPPAPGKVQVKLKNAISRIKQYHNDLGPLTAAITAHLEIAAIQPFMDGNKRVARLIQDRILYDIGLPPAIITAGEGKYYRDLLGKTLSAYREEDLEGQKQFYNYCASKVNNSLDDILGDLQEEP